MKYWKRDGIYYTLINTPEIFVYIQPDGCLEFNDHLGNDLER